MAIRDIAMAAAGALGGEHPYIEDVFSTYLYTGTGSTQTINNGIDLAGEGGLVWIKNRTAHANSGNDQNVLFNTNRGSSKYTFSNLTNAEVTSSVALSSFDTGGFTLNTAAITNESGVNFASWTFRKAEKFFDVVTYTGDGSSNRTIAHNLGSTPGCVIVKCTSLQVDWYVYHRTQGTKYGKLNSTSMFGPDSQVFFYTAGMTDTTFGVTADDYPTNKTGETYVAYLFAHDAGGFGDDGEQNVISCGSFTATAGGGASVTLGYEPQWIVVKRTNASNNWLIEDVMRGMPAGGGYANGLFPNLFTTEGTSNTPYQPTATGFVVPDGNLTSGDTFIYIAIRRGPMKTPDSGSEVFQTAVYTGTNTDDRLVNTGIVTDMVMIKERNDTNAGFTVGDRLRGRPYFFSGSSTTAHVDDADAFMANAFATMSGVYVGNDATAKVNIDTTTDNHVALAFKRAAKTFDVVVYNGTGSGTTISHNLGSVPTAIFIKKIDGTTNSPVRVWISGMASNKALSLASTSGASTGDWWNATAPTSNVFSVGTHTDTNASNGKYVAYLFSDLPSVCKAGTYVGNGSSQVIDCGFTTGARFVLIKRDEVTTGNWQVWDSARGITSGNDPYIRPEASAAEVATDNLIGPDSSGFEIVSSASSVNTNGNDYRFIAIS